MRFLIVNEKLEVQQEVECCEIQRTRIKATLPENWNIITERMLKIELQKIGCNIESNKEIK